jgi:hypothetical protein
MTQGCGQGTDNSICQLNQNPTPAPRQNTTPNSPVDCNVNPNDPSCRQQNMNNSPNQDVGSDNNNGGANSTGSPSVYSGDYHNHH